MHHTLHLLAPPLFVAVALSSSHAQGASVTSQERVIPTDIWRGIFTEQQAERGSAVFQAHCATCHDANTLGEAPALAADAFLRRWEGSTVGRLYTKILETMPPNNVQSVCPIQKLDVLTFILRENGFPSGGNELTGDAEALARIQIVPEGGPAPLRTGAMVQVVGCLTKAPLNAWLLTRSTEPAGTTLDLSPPGDVETSRTRTLGAETIRLVSVFPSPEAITGHRVEAKGLLIRTDTDVAINVVALRSIAPTCP